jgi:integral membrane sensor domain MASE1
MRAGGAVHSPESGPTSTSPGVAYCTTKMRREDLQDRGAGRSMWELFCVFAAYSVAGKIGLAAPFTSGNVSPLWPPAGIALASMLMFGYRVWPAVALGALVVNFLTPVPHVSAVGIAFGNTLGPLCGTWLLRRLPTFHTSLTSLRDVLGLNMAAIICAAASATV